MLDKHRWIVFVLPMVVYAIVGSLEPTPERPGGAMLGLAFPYAWYPAIYTIKIGLTLLAIALVARGYRQLSGRPSVWSVVVGIVGVVVWVGLWRLGLDRRAFDLLGLGAVADMGARPAYDPLEQLAGLPGWIGPFLAVRFLGLAVVVPIVEEVFLRGFLMRVVMAADWWTVPLGRVDRWAIAVSLAWPILTHPAEMLPAVVWFAMITCLMVKTRNLWDCVVAHAVTNLLLGIYVMKTGAWALW